MLDNGETFTEADLLALLSSVAAGLDRAHRVGVLHGDIRPENILVHEDGTTAATGFGASPARVDPPDAHGPARSEEHTSELQSLMRISYAVFCLKKKKKKTNKT